jgi:hypothetical protein
MRSKISRRAVLVGAPAIVVSTALPSAAGIAAANSRWSPAQLKAANELSQQLVCEAWRRLDEGRSAFSRCRSALVENQGAADFCGAASSR